MDVSMSMIAAQKDFDLSNLLYLLIVFVFPLLNSIGERIRKKFGREGESEAHDTPKVRVEGAARTPKASGRRVTRTPVGGPRMEMHGPPKPPPVAPARPARRRPPVAHPVPSPPTRERPPAAPPRSKAAVVRPTSRRRHGSEKEAERQTPRAAVERSRRLTMVEQLVQQADSPTRTTDRRQRRALLPQRVDAASLRSAVILSEILQPPLALREDDGGFALR